MDDNQLSKMKLLRKIIIITIIVLLVLWFIFFMRLSLKVNNNIDDTNYDKNMALMEKAAKEYFTKDVIKEDKLISLKEMYKLGLIEELKTSYNKKCIDIASFAKISEIDNKYKLDITLVCGNNNKTKTIYYNL